MAEGHDFNDVSKLLGKRWGEMDTAARAPYEKIHLAEKVRAGLPCPCHRCEAADTPNPFGPLPLCSGFDQADYDKASIKHHGRLVGNMIKSNAAMDTDQDDESSNAAESTASALAMFTEERRKRK